MSSLIGDKTSNTSSTNEAIKFNFTALKKNEPENHSSLHNLFITFINMHCLADFVFGINKNPATPIPIPPQPNTMDQFSADNTKVTKYKQDYKLYSAYMYSNGKAFLALQTLAGDDYKHCITQEMVEKVDTIGAYQSLIDATYLNKSNNTSIILEQELFKLHMESVEDSKILETYNNFRSKFDYLNHHLDNYKDIKTNMPL